MAATNRAVVEGAKRGLLTGRVAVEREDDLAGERVVVHEQPARYLDVGGAEGGAARGDGGADAGEVARHHVRVPLDHDGLLLRADRLAREVDPVEHLGLLVQQALGGVQVLWSVVIVEQLAGAESDRVAGQIADRPHEPTSEPVVHAALAARDEAAGQQLVVTETLRPQVRGERVPAAGGEPDAEVLAAVGSNPRPERKSRPARASGRASCST